ncbi:MAG: bifunctional UDP-sugar hydrolase/5'-nucleotidase [Actinomycetaceae bacterium]|nr:bifunctional UDP-sugar hydrolase/5'-nucleotidase [Actinomycetaceae bacterium]
MGDTADEVTLDLYNLTDVHGHIEKKLDKKGKVKEAGLAAMGCYLKEARATNPNSSFTLLGDNIGASPYTSGSLDDNPTIAALNKLSPLASTVGNHEFDLGVEVFKNRIDGANGFTKVEFPYLGANVEGLEDKYMGDYVVWESASGVKVAFIGAIAEDVPYKLSPGAVAGLTFTDPHAKIAELAKKIKDEGEADVVIAMFDDDAQNNYPLMPEHVDGLMGGDTHVPYQFSWVDTNAGHKISAISSGSYTDNLANLRITYDKNTGKVTKSEAILIPAAEVAQCGEDEDIKAIVDKAVADSEVAGEKVISTGLKPFYRGVFENDKGEITPGSNRGIESTLGNMAADAMKATIKTDEGEPVDIGIINAGGLRTDLLPNEQGEVTYAQTFAVMPFSNQLGYVTITGADFKEALEQQWKTNLSSQNSRPLLKLGISSNVSYTYDPSLPFGERITSVFVDGAPLDLEKNYTIGSVTFLLAGGDSFPALTAGGDYKITDELDRERFNDYLRDNHGLEPTGVKHAIGVTLPEGALENGSVAEVKLRGLSFSEPAFQTENVTVTLGDEGATAAVDNSLVDPNASNENAIITADGAGQATVLVPVNADCTGNAGNVIALPLTVDTDFARVVTEDQGLSVSVQCPAEETPAPPAPSQPTEKPAKPADPAQPGGDKLAVTGADVTNALLVAATMLLLGGGLVASVRYRMR